MLESQPGSVLFSDTARGGGSGTEDQMGLGTPGEGLLHDTFKPPDGVRPYHRMVGRVSSLPRLSGSLQHALIATSRHSFKTMPPRQWQTSGIPGVGRRFRVMLFSAPDRVGRAACNSSELSKLTSVGFLLSGDSWGTMDPQDES